MELWFTEKHCDGAKFSFKVDKCIYSGESPFQRIDVFETEAFGVVLTLDGITMLTERDEFIYHEMIVHPPMATNPDIKNVLVIGAGDGGTIRELVRYDSIENIDMVEIDKQVVEVCRKYLPQTACGFDDERVNLYFEDGLRFVRSRQNKYDLVVVDSTDAVGPGEGLFTREFYGNCYNALKENGIMVNQHESPFYPEDAKLMKMAHARINSLFPVSTVYQAHIPTYPSGHWLFGYASKGIDPIAGLDEDYWIGLDIETKYYNTELHKGCFALPNYVKEMLEDEDD